MAGRYQLVFRRPVYVKLAVVLAFDIGKQNGVGIDAYRKVIAQVDVRQRTYRRFEDFRGRRVLVGTVGPVRYLDLYFIVRIELGLERSARAPLFGNPVDEPFYYGTRLNRHVGGYLHRDFVAGADGFRTYQRNDRIEVAEVFDRQNRLAVLLPRRVGVNRVVGFGFRHDARYTATVAVTVHGLGQIQGRENTVRVAAYTERIGVDAFVGRKRIGKRIDQINPVAVARIHLPLVSQVYTRSRNLERGHRTVADRRAFGMLDDTRVGNDIHPGGVADATLPRFVDFRFITRGGARTYLNGIATGVHRHKERERRPRVSGAFATARYAYFNAFAGQDVLVGRDADFGLVDNMNPDDIGLFGLVVNATQARIQIYPNMVAVGEVLNHIVTARLNRIAVAVPYKYRIVTRVDGRLRKADRYALAGFNRIKVGGDIGGNLYVDASVEFHLHRDGRRNIRTLFNALQTRINRHANLVAVVEAVDNHGGGIGHTRQRVAVQAPFKVRRVGVEAVAPTVTAYFKCNRRAFANIVARQDGIDNRVNLFDLLGTDILNRRRPAVFIGRAILADNLDFVGAHHALGKVRTHGVLFGGSPATRTLPIVLRFVNGIGGKEERIFRTNQRVGVNVERGGVAGYRPFGETVGKTARKGRYEFRLRLHLNEAVRNTTQVSRGTNNRAIFGNETIRNTAQVARTGRGDSPAPPPG